VDSKGGIEVVMRIFLLRPEKNDMKNEQKNDKSDSE
jgi:hypothetical protein